MKMPDLNAASIEAAMSMIAGTARSMGIVVEDQFEEVGAFVAFNHKEVKFNETW